MWEEHFDSLLPLVKEYVVDVWEARKIKLYGDDTSQSQSSTGDLGEFTGIVGQSGKNMCQGGKPDTGKFHSSYIGMNVCGEWVRGRWHVCYGSGLSIITDFFHLWSPNL